MSEVDVLVIGGGSAGCVACAAPWRTWLALVGVALLAAGVLVFLVRGTLRSRGEPSRLEIIMLKVLMTHLQTVALAAEFDLRWPNWLFINIDLLDSWIQTAPLRGSSRRKAPVWDITGARW